MLQSGAGYPRVVVEVLRIDATSEGTVGAAEAPRSARPPLRARSAAERA